jgi:hypothetical protein
MMSIRPPWVLLRGAAAVRGRAANSRGLWFRAVFCNRDGFRRFDKVSGPGISGVLEPNMPVRPAAKDI